MSMWWGLLKLRYLHNTGYDLITRV